MDNIKFIVFSYDEIRLFRKVLDSIPDRDSLLLSFYEWHTYKNISRHFNELEKELNHNG